MFTLTTEGNQHSSVSSHPGTAEPAGTLTVTEAASACGRNRITNENNVKRNSSLPNSNNIVILLDKSDLIPENS